MKAVFDAKPNSGYDDEIVRRYHFPTRGEGYLASAEAAVGDWIVYRGTRRGGQPGYFAVARVTHLEADLARPAHMYAYVSDYLPFDRVIPFEVGGRYWEAPVRAVDRRAVGRSVHGKSVRPLGNQDFCAIVAAGLDQTLAPENAVRLGLAGFPFPGLEEIAAHFDDGGVPGLDHVRRVEEVLVSRKIRDASFRRQICEAYDDRCAVTGLRIINGGGRSEVQAAHIWSVADGGPDVVQNGLALSGTVHWLFDRHLISLTDRFELLVSHNKVPAELRGLFASQMNRIHLPQDERLWPHPTYLERHRERFMVA